MSLENRVYSMGDIWNTGTSHAELYQSIDDLNTVANAWESELRTGRSWGRRAMNFVRGLFGLKPKQPRIGELFSEQLIFARKAHRGLTSMLGQLSYELDRSRAYQHKLMDEVEGYRKEYHALRQDYGSATAAYRTAEETLAGKKLGEEGYVPAAKALKTAQAQRDDLERTVTLVHDRIALTGGLISDAEGMEHAINQALGAGQLLAQRTDGMIRHLETLSPMIERYTLTGQAMGDLLRQAETLSRRAKDIYSIAGGMARAYQRIGDDARRAEPMPFGGDFRQDAPPKNPFADCEELLGRIKVPTNGVYAGTR